MRNISAPHDMCIGFGQIDQFVYQYNFFVSMVRVFLGQLVCTSTNPSTIQSKAGHPHQGSGDSQDIACGLAFKRLHLMELKLMTYMFREALIMAQICPQSITAISLY